MKNERLEELTEMAANVSQSMARLYLNGDGQFIDANLPGDGSAPREVPASEVLMMFTQAERAATRLHIELKNEPRRKAARAPKVEDFAA